MKVKNVDIWWQRANDYAMRVLDDDRTTGRLTRLAADRFLRDVRSRKWYIDKLAIAEACEFFEKLPPPSGEQFGRFLRLSDWQVFLLANVEGFRIKGKPPKGLKRERRFRQAALWTARKSGKSTIAAAMMLQDLTIANRKGSRQLAIATTKDQANNVLDNAVAMARTSKSLCNQFKLRPTDEQISRRDELGGVLVSLTGNAKSHDGKRPTFVCLDEIHALTDRNMLNVMTTAFGSTYSPLMFMPSTAGDQTESVGKNQYDMQMDILRSNLILDDIFSLPFVPDKDDDPYSETTWLKANPALKITVPISYYKSEAAKAQKDKKDETFFLTRQCNFWKSGGAERWLNLDEWDACADAVFKDHAAARVYIGLDSSAIDDLTAICILCEMPSGDIHAGFEMHCAEKTIAKKAVAGMRHYDAWRTDGSLRVCGCDRIDNDAIAARLDELTARLNVKRIVIDQYAGASIIASKLGYQAKDITRRLRKTADTVTESCRDLEARIRSGQGYTHDGNKIARWCASNVCVRRYVDESLIPQKESANSESKIDAIDALVFANCGRLLLSVGQSIDVEVASDNPRVLWV